MASPSRTSLTDKVYDETYSDANGHAEDAKLRQRNKPDRNGVARRDFNGPIGGYGAESDPQEGHVLSRPPTSHTRDNGNAQSHKHRRIRRRLRAKKESRVPLWLSIWWTQFLHSETKNNIVAVIGEFIGTTMFLFFAFAGTAVANIGAGETATQTTTGSSNGFNVATQLYISLSFGFSLMVNAWVFFRISGGLFNPAVTLALCLLGAIGPLRALLLFIAQMGGACFAAYLVSVMFPTPFNVQTTLGGGTSVAQGVWIEAMCTSMLVFTIVMLAMEKHRATFIAPVGIGLSLFIGELVAVYYTGGSLNPARSFGPAAVTHSFESHHWIYWVGPFVGATLAVLAYWLFKALEYEMANPGQDGDYENDPTQNPEHEMAQIVEERQEEVEEIKAIQEEGGFEAALENLSAAPSVIGEEGVIGMAVDGVRDGDEVHVKRVRSREEDLEAAWPKTQGVDVAAAKLETESSSPKITKKSSFAGSFGSGKKSPSLTKKKSFLP